MESARSDRERARRTPASALATSGLAVRGLEVRYGGVRAVDNVTLEARMGRITGLVGPNGAGKSTFFNCLTGVLRPTSGRIVFNGDDISGLSSDKISQKGIARSYPVSYTHLDVYKRQPGCRSSPACRDAPARHALWEIAR